MDGRLSARRRVAHQTLVHVLAQEGHDRREQLDQRRERFIQRLICSERISLGARLPESRAVAPQVPRREVIPERLELVDRRADVVCVHRRAAIGYDPRKRRQDPPIHERALGERYLRRGRIEVVEGRVGDKEGVRVR